MQLGIYTSAAVSSKVHKTMEDIASPWRSWCRVCAKEDAENNVNIHFSDKRQSLPTDEDANLTLEEALEKYFSIHSSCEDLLPQQLCLDCYSLISSIMLFNERVVRVQQMYKFLLENDMYDVCDMKSVRRKFDVSDVDGEQRGHFQNKTDYVSDNFQTTKVDIESNVSDCGENDDIDNESEDIDSVVYEEEYIDNQSQEEYEDQFETMSEDNCWDEDEEKIDSKSRTKKRTSASIIKENDANTVGTSKDKVRGGQLRDNNCMKKKKPVEDFVFYAACKECGQKFDLYSTYCEHMEESHGNASMEKLCPICDRNLQTWYHLGRHMRVHMPLEYRKPIKCPECDNRYTTSAQLDVHINHKHRNEKPFICEVCGFRGGTKNSLQQHLHIHTDNPAFECEVCKKKFKTRSRLNFHMDIHEPNKFVCAICGLQLSSRATLKNHRVVHSDEVRHKCDYCGKGFKLSKSLKSHLLLHSGLKPYSCNFCDRAFSLRGLCTAHMSRKHPDQWASLEASGSKAYTSNVPRLETLRALAKDANNLRNLERKKGNGSYCCEFCDLKFARNQSCKNHMMKHHPNELAALEASGKRIKKKNKKKVFINWMNFGKSEICDFCNNTYANRKICRDHIRRVHPEVIEAYGYKTHHKNMPKLESTKTETIATDNLRPAVATKSSDCLTNELETMEKTNHPLDLTHCESTTTATNIQDYFVLLD